MSMSYFQPYTAEKMIIKLTKTLYYKVLRAEYQWSKVRLNDEFKAAFILLMESYCNGSTYTVN